jgi:hypothetical protein
MILLVSGDEADSAKNDSAKESGRLRASRCDAALRAVMNLSGWAVIVSLVSGGIRAAQLFRASGKVDAVNAVVLATLANGRGRELPNLLSRSGSALYLRVARAISVPLDKLLASNEGEARRRLEGDAQIALMAANRTLGRFAWLDFISLAAIVLAGVSAVTAESPSPMQALGLIAATLLWLSNLYGTRSIATRMFAGAMALVDGLVAGRDQIRSANAHAAAAAEPRDG